MTCDSPDTISHKLKISCVKSYGLVIIGLLFTTTQRVRTKLDVDAIYSGHEGLKPLEVGLCVWREILWQFPRPPP